VIRQAPIEKIVSPLALESRAPAGMGGELFDFGNKCDAVSGCAPVIQRLFAETVPGREKRRVRRSSRTKQTFHLSASGSSHPTRAMLRG